MDGLITHEIGETLARYSARVPAGEAIVELGSYKGMSTCYLAGARK
jgi:predicted O-methyltransferase YrrM